MNSTIEILKPNFQEPKNISEIRKSGLTDNENSDNSSSDETPKKNSIRHHHLLNKIQINQKKEFLFIQIKYIQKKNQ